MVVTVTCMCICKNKFVQFKTCIITADISVYMYVLEDGDRRGRDHMAVGFTTACTINVYHH